MKFLTTSKAIHVLVLATTLFGIQSIVSETNANSQTANDVNNWVKQDAIDADAVINSSLEQERRHISQLSCRQLRSEAIDLEKAGDRMAAQGYTSQAQGYYASAERRSSAYSRNCR